MPWAALLTVIEPHYPKSTRCIRNRVLGAVKASKNSGRSGKIDHRSRREMAGLGVSAQNIS